MPKPKKNFSRPVIDLTPHGKAWQDTAVVNVRQGDMVQGWGLVTSVNEERAGRTLAFADGKSVHWPNQHVIHAFTAKAS